jgi:hypothetical protein
VESTEKRLLREELGYRQDLLSVMIVVDGCVNSRHCEDSACAAEGSDAVRLRESHAVRIDAGATVTDVEDVRMLISGTELPVSAGEPPL